VRNGKTFNYILTTNHKIKNFFLLPEFISYNSNQLVNFRS